MGERELVSKVKYRCVCGWAEKKETNTMINNDGIAMNGNKE